MEYNIIPITLQHTSIHLITSLACIVESCTLSICCTHSVRFSQRRYTCSCRFTQCLAAVQMCILKHVSKSRGRGILTVVTHSYLSPWPHPLSHRLLLWGFCHYGNRDISSELVVRFCSREGVNEKRKWRIKREAAKEGGEEMREGVEGKERDFAGVCGYPRSIAVCYQGNCSM